MPNKIFGPLHQDFTGKLNFNYIKGQVKICHIDNDTKLVAFIYINAINNRVAKREVR